MSTILIVEDDDKSRYMLERLLESKGHHITAAVNGQDALRLAQQNPPELIISDIMMPVMNGFKLCREIKKDPGLRNIPFIFYTATFVEKTDEKLAMSLGASGFIVKPKEGEALIQILDDVLNEHRKGILPVPEGPLEDEDILIEMYENSITRKLTETVEKLQDERITLVKSERRLKEAQELAHVGHWELDLKSNSLEWSDEIYRILGLKPQEFDPSYKTFIEMKVVHPDDRTYVTRARKDSLSKMMPCDIEYRLLFEDGTVKYVHEKFQTLFDDNGMPTCSMGTVQDITERKKTVRALKEANDIINKSSSVAFTWQNQEGWPVAFVSENVERILGFRAEEFITGKTNYADCVHPEDLERVAREVTEVSCKPETTEFTHEPYRIIAKDGSEKIIRDWTYIVRDNAGRVVQYKGILEDITEQKRAKEDRVKLQAQLNQAQKMEAIGLLAGGIAHDFNNILGAILGYSELAKMKAFEGRDVIADLNKVIKASDRAAKLVEQILTISRQHRQKRKPVQIRYMVKEALQLLRSTLPTTIEIKEDLAKDSGIVNADPTQIHQVIMNLCTNAAHAMREEGGVLAVDIANVELDDLATLKNLDLTTGSYLILTISDTGHGMPLEIKERIFDPYFTTKNPGDGTGLGLSVVQGIVKTHGGAITVYSEPGKGTTFHVYLPVTLEKESENEKTEKPLPRGTERILFVDDERVLVEIARQMLEWSGYEVVIKTSSIEALELFQKKPNRFDLVITDLTMPHMTGDKLAQELIRIRPDIPVILCTGHSKQISEEKARGLGIRAFVMKPISNRVVAEVVRKVLDENKMI